jgi:hypothetical protein
MPVRRVFDLLPRSYHDPTLGHRRLDRLHIIIEPDAEVGVVPPHDRVLDLGQQEGHVVAQLRKAERLIVHRGVDAEAAGVGAAQAADHGHDLDRRSLGQGRRHELPALFQRRKLERLLEGGDLPSEGTVRLALPADLGHGGTVGEAEHVVVILARIFGIASGVRAAEHGNRPPFPEEVAQRIGQLCRLGKRPDKHHIEIGRELLQQILQSGVADHPDVMPFLLAPHAEDLGHDARQIGVHHSPVQGRIGTLGDEIENANSQPAHAGPSDGGTAGFPGRLTWTARKSGRTEEELGWARQRQSG